MGLTGKAYVEYLLIMLLQYVKAVVDLLDPTMICCARFCRSDCDNINMAGQEIYVKDLTRLGRSMKRVIIIDNNPVCYMWHVENAVGEGVSSVLYSD